MSLILSDCSNGLQLFTVEQQRLGFNAAQQNCLDNGGQLAIPRSLQQFLDIEEFQTVGGFDNSFWIGLRDLANTGGNDPNRFFGTDGQPNPFTSELDNGEFPWLGSEPSDQGGIENCVEFEFGRQGLNDLNCINANFFVCERSCVSDCVNGLQYTMNTRLMNFTESEAFCSSIGAQLAIPSSADRFEAIKSFSEPFSSRVILGLVDSEDIGGSGNTNRFIGVDGQPNGFTNREAQQEPWGSTEPNDFNGNQNCVEINRQFNGDVLVDTECDKNVYSSVCESYCGTRPEFVFSECVNDIQLYFNPEQKQFDEATVDCKSIDVNGRLAIPDDQQKFDRIIDFLEVQDQIGSSAFLGLRNFVETAGTTNFLTVNGEVNTFTAGQPGELPWFTGKPDNFNNVEFCVSLEYGLSLLDDRNCIELHQSVCERPCVAQVDSAFVLDSCSNGIQLFLNTENKNFDDASVSCSSFDASATLAIPNSGDKLIKMKDLRERIVSENPFIGLRNFEEDAIADPAKFLTINNETNPFSSGQVGVFPWQSGEPNNFNGGQFCGTLFGLDGDLDDNFCAGQRRSICERYCGIRPNFFFLEECVNDIQLFFNPELRTFDAAEADCQSIGGTLAIPVDETLLQNMTDLVELHKTSNLPSFIGLRDFFNAAVDTQSFLTLKGEVIYFTSGNIGEFPWVTGQPDGNVDGNRCIALSADNQGLIFDTTCNDPSFSICQRPCPIVNVLIDEEEEVEGFEAIKPFVFLGAGVLGFLLSLFFLILRLEEKKKREQLRANLRSIELQIVKDDEGDEMTQRL